jgi:hypothetical protein
MRTLRRALDAGLLTLERWIERACDPDRVTLLERTLVRLNDQYLQLLDENDVLHQRLMSEHQAKSLVR